MTYEMRRVAAGKRQYERSREVVMRSMTYEMRPVAAGGRRQKVLHVLPLLPC
jgi:hypothetical protein